MSALIMSEPKNNQAKTQFKPRGEIPRSKQPIGVRLPLDLDAIVRSLENRTEWIESAIREKLERENRL